MTISVLIAAYNSMPYVAEALESVLVQLGPYDEVVIQDARSTDGTTEVYAAAAARDQRVSVVSEPDGGQSEGLNRALRRATKDYVLWLNADDLVLPGAIDDYRAALAARGTALTTLVTAGHEIVRADGSLISAYRARPLARNRIMSEGCYIFSGSLLIDRETLVRLGAFSADLHYCMDLDLLFRLAALPEAQVALLDRPVGALRWHDASKSGSQSSGFLRESWLVRSRYRRGVGDRARQAFAGLVMVVSASTTRLRHSAVYGKLRGRIR